MPPLSAYALFLAAGLALLVVPGPAVLYIVGRSIDQGRKAGVVSAMGIPTGTLVHTALATAGLSSLVLASRVAFGAVRYAGAAYLVLLGVRRLLDRDADTALGEPDPRSLRRVYAQGAVVNSSTRRRSCSCSRSCLSSSPWRAGTSGCRCSSSA